MPSSDLPPNVSCAVSGDDGRLHAPAAERNAQAISSVLQSYAPATGRALELASGTGQHVARFARDLPGLIWQPTEVDTMRLESIEAWRAGAGCDNLLPPDILDATQPGWGSRAATFDLILVVNLLHLITIAQAETIVSEAAQALQTDGVLLIYGPFLREGEAKSAGDRAFDAQLRAANPEIGYKDCGDIMRCMQEAGLDELEQIEMPANNLVVRAVRR
ncbi:MAG: DUF938 domain-containing protein [Pseudomonadota bacterium]